MNAVHRITWPVSIALVWLPCCCALASGPNDATTVHGLLARKFVRSPQGDETRRSKATLAIYTVRLSTPYLGPQPWGRPGRASHPYKELQVICNTHYVVDCDTILQRNTGHVISMTGAITAAVEPNEVLPMVIEPSSIEETKRHKR